MADSIKTTGLTGIVTPEGKRVLLSLKNVSVKFNVRGRILTAIRNVSLDIYENESIAIVGESGSGKSVLTKTFAGMLDANGFISEGSIVFSDDELSVTDVKLTPANRRLAERVFERLNKYPVLERGAEEQKQILALEARRKQEMSLSAEEESRFEEELKALRGDMVETTNYMQTLDRHSETDAKEIQSCQDKLKRLEEAVKAKEQERAELIREHARIYRGDTALRAKEDEELKRLRALREEKMARPDKAGNPEGLSDEVIQRNRVLSWEVLLSIGRYPRVSQFQFVRKLNKGFREAMSVGEDVGDRAVKNRIFQTCVFWVEFRSLDETGGVVHGYAEIDCAHVRYPRTGSRSAAGASPRSSRTP